MVEIILTIAGSNRVSQRCISHEDASVTKVKSDLGAKRTTDKFQQNRKGNKFF